MDRVILASIEDVTSSLNLLYDHILEKKAQVYLE